MLTTFPLEICPAAFINHDGTVSLPFLVGHRPLPLSVPADGLTGPSLITVFMLEGWENTVPQTSC